MSKKVLPITQPTITSWAWQANTFAILEAHQLGEEWLYSNYIQLVGNNFSNTVNIDFYPRGDVFSVCPLFFGQQLERSFVDSIQHNPIDFLKLCIDNGRYVYVVLNYSDILKFKNFYHDSIIYGYDDTHQEIYLAEFIFRKRYSFEAISYDQFANAYLTVPPEQDYMNDWRGGVQLIQVNPSYPPYKFDIHFVKESLYEYLNGVETANRYRGVKSPFANEVYGLDIYDLLINFCSENKVNYKPFSVVKDHHTLMIKRLRYMQENNFISNCQDIIDEYESLINVLHIVVNKQIKYALKHTVKPLNDIITQLQIIKSMDAQLVEKTLDRIKGQPLYFQYQDLRKSKK